MSITDLEGLYEYPRLNNTFDSNIYSKHRLDLSFSNISSNDELKSYHFLCKSCKKVPLIKFIKKNIIRFTCKCKNSPQKIKLTEIFNHLVNFEETGIDISDLTCKKEEHEGEKYMYYCKECKNICRKCLETCIEHDNDIKQIVYDRNTINISKYINKILEERKNQKNIIQKDNILTEELEEGNNPSYKLIQKKSEDIDTTSQSSSNNDKNNINNDTNYFKIIDVNKNIKNEVKEIELTNITNENNDNNINEEEKNCAAKLFSIIIQDYKDYPNYNHIKTIENIEKYIIAFLDDCEQLNLKYQIVAEDFENKYFNLFGDLFVNNNKENCFLIINEKIMKLKKFIRLSKFFDDSKNIFGFPIILEVKLIKKKYKKMNNISCMFYEINSLLPTSDFSKFNTINVTKMSYLFCNCSKLIKLPDISIIKTDNVTDMSYMFYNCSSLTNLPDISKFNTKNVIDMSCIFCKCSSLIELPDISKWNMENIMDISYMFCDCESIVSIPQFLIFQNGK